MGRPKKTKEVKKEVKSETHKRKELAHLRPCHDCGKLQIDYRCSKCLIAWRNKHNVYYGDLIVEGIRPTQIRGKKDE